MKISVLGSGGWGIALAMAANRNNHDVLLWSLFEEEICELKKERESKRLLEGVKISEEIKLTSNILDAENSDIVIVAVPSVAVRKIANMVAQLKNIGIVVNVAKGLEEGSLKRLSEVIEEEVNAPVVVLSGPSHAEEVARSIPTSLVSSSHNMSATEKVIEAFSSASLRIYNNDDLVGVELGGALKNVIAVAAGFCDGMGLGDNTKAALITRGLTEIARLGVKMGAKERTFAGLTGLGDLIVTCTSKHSRNHRFGEMVGKGVDVKKALSEVGTVEGYYATKFAYLLAEKVGAEMPIISQCYKVLYEGTSVMDTVKNLMLRPSKNEYENLWI